MKTFYIFILMLTLTIASGCTNDTNPLVADNLGDNEITSTSQVSNVHTKVNTQMERDIVYIDLRIPSDCLDEMIHLEGPVYVRIHTTIDGRGVVHQQAFYNWKDVTATGVESGNAWHTTSALELYVVNNYDLVEPFQPVPSPTKLGDPSVFHHTGAMRFLADDNNSPDLYVRHLVHIVTDPDGNVLIMEDELELLDCQ